MPLDLYVYIDLLYKTHESTEQSQESKCPKHNMMTFVPAQGSQVVGNVNNEQPRTVENASR